MKRFVPLLILIILVPLISFMMYPMINMEPRDLHVGIVNKDRGAEFDQGTVNLGGKIIDTITDPDTDSDTESPVVWEVFDSEDDAKAAMKHKKIYGYLIIPGNFSSKQTQTLTAFNNLGSALGKMSEGTAKMGSGIDQAGGKLTKIPKAFRNLSTAIAKLGDGAGGLQQAVGMMGNESASITEAAAAIDANADTVQTDISDVQTYIEAAETALSGETPDLEAAQSALTDATTALDNTETAISDANTANASSVASIMQNAGMISAQTEGVNTGLAGIQQAGTTMSSKLTEMAGKMGGVSNITKLGSALDQLSDGLGEMSDTMDENVSDAIATMNGETDADENDTVKLKFYIDQSRNVLVTSTLTGMMNGISANSGLSIETKYINKIPDELNNFYFAMVFMMLVMFTSMIPGILTGFLTRPTAGSKAFAKAKTSVGQILLVAAIAVCLGFIIPRAIAWMGSFDLPVDRLTPFIMICCFGMLMLIVGAIDLFGKPGVAFPVLIMICGTAVANLPYEYLPSFWQKYIFPWEPLRFIAEGVREIIYRGGESLNQYAFNMLWLVAIGAAFMLLSILKRGKKNAIPE